MSQTPQSVADLFGRYLRRQMAAHAEGLRYADPDGLAMPYEAVPVQPVEPRLAWQDALAVVPHATSERVSPHWETPPDWPSLVATQEPAVALAFCLGNFPQMVRDLQLLLTGGGETVLHRAPNRLVAVSPTLIEWANAERTYPQVLLAVGVLRLARRFEEASALLTSKGKAPAAWRSLRANEEAALAWHRGDAEEAFMLWQAQKDSVPVLFNRGMASLFLGRAAEAQTALSKAVASLPETSAWHHLGQLYLTLATAGK